MKLYIKLFNRKFDVSTSNGNVRRVYEMQLKVAKNQAVSWYHAQAQQATA